MPLLKDSFAVLGCIDPDNYAAGSTSSDWVDAGRYANVTAILATGDLGAGSTLDAKLEQATSSGGAGAKDVANKAITQVAAASPPTSDKQYVINLLPSDLDMDNRFRYVRLTVTTVAGSPPANDDFAAFLIGWNARHDPATALDLSSVDEIV